MWYRLLLLIAYLSHAVILPKESAAIEMHVNPKAPQGGYIRLPHLGRPRSFEAYTSKPAYPGLNLVYQTLISQTSFEGTYLTLLAKKIDSYPHHTLITLDPRAEFHNGKSLDTDDVLYSLERFKTGSHPLRQKAQNITIQVLNPQKILLRHRLSLENLEYLLSIIPILPKDHIESDGIGTGPYQIQDYSDHEIVYQKTNYWGSSLPFQQGRYNFDTVIYRFYASYPAETQAFEAGEIDYYLEHSAYHWEHRKPTGLCYQVLPHTRQHYQQMLWYNPDKAPLDDPKLRSVLQALIDPAYVNQWLFYGHYKTQDGHTTQKGYLQSSRTHLIQAAQYLDEAGWILHSNGYRYRHGQKLTLTVITHHRQLEPFLLLLQDLYNQLGIDLQIERLSKAHYLFQKKHHAYHLIINPLVLDQTQKSQDILDFLNHYQTLPKFSLLYHEYPKLQGYLAYPVLKTMLHLLEDQHLISPLWSIDHFRIGYHPRLRFIHKDQSFIDVHTWWSE